VTRGWLLSSSARPASFTQRERSVLGRAAQPLCVPLEARLHHLVPNFEALFGQERAAISGKAFTVLQSSSCTKFGGDPFLCPFLAFSTKIAYTISKHTTHWAEIEVQEKKGRR
jgi:hypothetical protein